MSLTIRSYKFWSAATPAVCVVYVVVVFWLFCGMYCIGWYAGRESPGRESLFDQPPTRTVVCEDGKSARFWGANTLWGAAELRNLADKWAGKRGAAVERSVSMLLLMSGENAVVDAEIYGTGPCNSMDEARAKVKAMGKQESDGQFFRMDLFGKPTFGWTANQPPLALFRNDPPHNEHESPSLTISGKIYGTTEPPDDKQPKD